MLGVIIVGTWSILKKIVVYVEGTLYHEFLS
jgi:hypothetical protein